jgi:ABC-2 type transport system permease protein
MTGRVRRSTVLRSLRLAALQLRLTATSGMAYRSDFLLEGVMALIWIALTLLPWFVLFDGRPTVAGWDRSEALVVIAYFTAVRAVLEGLISPSFTALIDHLRVGTLDYVLLKPADAQVMVWSSRCEPWKLFEILFAIGLAAYAFAERGEPPAPADVALGIVLLVAGILAVYSLWVMCAAAAFWIVRLDNLSYLLGAILDVARWPIDVFRGMWRVVFTYVIPVAVMTTFPAKALLGRLDASAAIGTIGGAVALVAGSRLVWRLAIRNYTSASS